MSLHVLIRDIEEEDINFVYSAWLKSYRSAPFATGCPNELYYKQHHVLIDAIRSRSKIKVMCDEMDANQIYGFICYEGGEHLGETLGVLHYVYIKQVFRNLGLARTLLTEAQETEGISHWFASHSTSRLKYLKSEFDIEYTPYVLLITK